MRVEKLPVGQNVHYLGDAYTRSSKPHHYITNRDLKKRKEKYENTSCIHNISSLNLVLQGFYLSS